MAGFRHGVYVEQVPTALVPAAPVESALPFVVGTAPVHTLDAEARPVNRPVVVRSLKQFVETFGAVPDGEAEADYTLAQFARVYLGLYGAEPFVAVNVFDPAVHQKADGAPSVAAVAATDVVGGQGVGGRAGVEVLESVVPTLGLRPTVLLAPRFSAEPAVAAALFAKADRYGGKWPAFAAVDVPGDLVAEADVLAWKAANGAGPGYVCWPPLNGAEGAAHPLSTHVAGLLAATDLRNGGVPIESPSNKRLKGVTGAAVALTDPEANALNAQGVVAVVREGVGGLVLWGNRLAPYPASTDPVEALVTARRMFVHIAHWVQANFRQNVDDPMSRKQLETHAKRGNAYLSSLGVPGRMAIYDEDNPTAQIVDGTVVYRLSFGSAPPTEDLTIRVQYDSEAAAAAIL